MCQGPFSMSMKRACRLTTNQKRLLLRRVVTAHTSGNKTSITVIACGSAAGQIIPPMVLFQGEKLNHTFTTGEVPGTMYGMGSGWVDTELFEAWFTDQFLVYAPKRRPLLLLLDGHASHYQPELVKLAAKENIILFCFPPHCTHLVQPLDKGAFSPLKTFWHQECARFMDTNPGEIVSKINFSSIFAQAWYRAMTPKTIAASFRVSGVYPFNKEAIQFSELPKLDEDKGVTSYLPLLLHSPAPKQRCSTGLCTSVIGKPEFSESEQKLFKTRYENGFDITTDCRYNQWLLQNTPKEDALPLPSSTLKDECSASTHSVAAKEQSSIRTFLQIPTAPSALKKNSEKKFRTARVLTSDVAIQRMEEKEKRKEEEERKEHRREERERRAKVRAEEQAERKRRIEEKRERAKEKEQTLQMQEQKKKERLMEEVQTQRTKQRQVKENISGMYTCFSIQLAHFSSLPKLK